MLRRKCVLMVLAGVLAFPAQGLGVTLFRDVFFDAPEQNGVANLIIVSVPGAQVTWTTDQFDVVAPGNANAPADYAASGGTVTFGPGETQKIVQVPIMNDAVPEPLETFRARITEVIGDTRDPIQTTGVRIIDDDGPSGCGNLIVGTSGPNVLRGALGLSNRIRGLAGNDTLLGSFGDDCLDGGAGNDRLLGNDGRDLLIGGLGRDSIAGGIGNDNIRGDAGSDNVGGQDGNDRVDGGAGDDRVFGGDGSDIVLGGPGNDVIDGQGTTSFNPGNDRLIGGPGRDQIRGGPGNDIILARDGFVDTITCGRGNDVATVDRTDVVRGCERVVRG